MKITELIAKLESIKAEHGDLRVTINTDGCDLDIDENDPSDRVFNIEHDIFIDGETHLQIMGYWGR